MARMQEVNFFHQPSKEIFDDCEAFPVLNLPNRLNNWLKNHTSNGERKLNASKVAAYLGYRVLSFSLIPTAANAISTLACAILSLITLPTRLCGKRLNDYCWETCQNSFCLFIGSIYLDVFYEVRGLLRACGCLSPAQT